jgi:hypothetical protein
MGLDASSRPWRPDAGSGPPARKARPAQAGRHGGDVREGRCQIPALPGLDQHLVRTSKDDGVEAAGLPRCSSSDQTVLIRRGGQRYFELGRPLLSLSAPR